ncbi:MAG: hydroxymethylbilane synthase [Bacteroidota bacterium]
MKKSWKIGTRASKLAMWQTHKVANALQQTGFQVDIEQIHSAGDLNQQQPLYELGISGIFTRSLDIALLEGRVDLAVHSLKDVPTQLAKGLSLAAVLPRACPWDVLIHKAVAQDLSDKKGTIIASGSLRRRAQWHQRYPSHVLENLRGNIQTRLRKLEEHDWAGIIMAEAALDRLEMDLQDRVERLDWMVPAPAQGIIGIVCREGEQDLISALQAIDHAETHACAELERSFMRTLEGGCTAPIGGYAQRTEKGYSLEGVVLSLDGQQAIRKSWEGTGAPRDLGRQWAQEMLAAGGAALMQEIRYVTEK